MPSKESPREGQEGLRRSDKRVGMSGVREKDVAALFVADLHLCHKPPVARSTEEDWYKAMKRQLQELTSLQFKHKCPVICAGDVFDKWSPPAELINFAIKELSLIEMYAVPGQHDLAYHSYEDIRKSGYWTLVEAGVIKNLPPNIPTEIEGATPIRLHGFPWGFPIQPLKDPHDLFIEIAVVHDYLWMYGCSYKDAPKEQHVGKLCGLGYDCFVYGDNHTPFQAVLVDNPRAEVFNCGGFFRRRSDEINHKPSVGLLHKNGSITRHYLDCSQDKFIEAPHEAAIIDNIDVEDFINELSGLADEGINFPTAIKMALAKKNPTEAVAQVIYKAME